MDKIKCSLLIKSTTDNLERTNMRESTKALKYLKTFFLIENRNFEDFWKHVPFFFRYYDFYAFASSKK